MDFVFNATIAHSIFGSVILLCRQDAVVGQITAIFERNCANDDTNIKFGTFVLQGILI